MIYKTECPYHDVSIKFRSSRGFLMFHNPLWELLEVIISFSKKKKWDWSFKFDLKKQLWSTKLPG